MTVNQMIQALEAIRDAGHGDNHVRMPDQMIVVYCTLDPHGLVYVGDLDNQGREWDEVYDRETGELLDPNDPLDVAPVIPAAVPVG